MLLIPVCGAFKTLSTKTTFQNKYIRTSREESQISTVFKHTPRPSFRCAVENLENIKVRWLKPVMFQAASVSLACACKSFGIL